MRGRLVSAVDELERLSYNLGWWEQVDNTYSDTESLDEEYTQQCRESVVQVKERLIKLIDEVLT